jgi:hypothetical protein
MRARFDRIISAWNSHGLLEFEHEFVHRLVGWRLDREITRVLWVAPEIAFSNKLKPCCLDLAAQRAFLNAMKGLGDRSAVAWI